MIYVLAILVLVAILLVARTYKQNQETVIRLSQRETELKQRESELAQLREECTALRGRVEALQQAELDLREAQVRLSQQGELIAKQESDLEELHEEMTLLRATLRSAEMDHQRAEAMVTAREEQIKVLENELKRLQTELEAQRQEQTQLAEKLRDSFHSVATEVIKERSGELEKSNETSLRPLQEQLRLFGERVDKYYTEEGQQRFSLKDAVEKLVLRSQEISTETTNLTQALRGDSKVQGDWGELVLDRILQQSGLVKGEHYTVQETLTDEQGNTLLSEDSRRKMRPDVIVRYPNKGAMVIDSKVSLTAYMRYLEATTDEERSRYAREHLQSLRKHIDELSAKKYEEYTAGSPNFVMLFIPNEPAYSLALQQEPSLWEYAYAKNVVLINGTNLIAALRMAQDMWQRDTQQRNVAKIIKEAAGLYKKFRGFVENYNKIGTKLQEASSVYEEARKALSSSPGNLSRRIDTFRDLGLKVDKLLPAYNEEDEPSESTETLTELPEEKK